MVKKSTIAKVVLHMVFVHSVTAPNVQLQAREEEREHWQAKSETQEGEEEELGRACQAARPLLTLIPSTQQAVRGSWGGAPSKLARGPRASAVTSA